MKYRKTLYNAVRKNKLSIIQEFVNFYIKIYNATNRKDISEYDYQRILEFAIFFNNHEVFKAFYKLNEIFNYTIDKDTLKNISEYKKEEKRRKLSCL